MMLIDVPTPDFVDPATDDQALHARVVALARQERALRADFIVSLGAFEERRLHLQAGYPTLFAWLTDHLGFSRASAFRRATAARLCRRMPAAAAYLREGRLSLTKLCHLKDVLEPESCLALLEQAASLTEREVEELAMKLDPARAAKPIRDSIRPLGPPAAPPASQPDLFVAAAAPSATPPSPPPAPATRAQPPTRHLLKMTVGSEFLALLEDVRAAMSHSHPGAPLEVLLAECMKLALSVRHARTRAQVARPRPSRAARESRARDIPAHVRRAIWTRDEARCTFVSAHGRRCPATYRLEIHHDLAYALGGAATVENCRLMCRPHNDLMARRDFGDDLMDRARQFQRWNRT